MSTRPDGHPVVRLVALAAALALMAVIGVLGVVAGEADDSPGLQFLGAVVVAGAFAVGVRSLRRRRRR